MYTNQSRDVFTTIARGFTASKAAAVLPATGNQTIFTIAGGRCLVSLLLGQVTTAVRCDRDQPQGHVGADRRIGGRRGGEPRGRQLRSGRAARGRGRRHGADRHLGGSGFAPALIAVPWVVPAGILRITTSATNVGATKWDIWYHPLDVGASIS
jgi:hypothetical protein